MSWPMQDGDQDQNPAEHGQPPHDQPQYGQQPQYGVPQYGQQPQYGQPAYGAPYPAPQAAPGTNLMAILSLVFAFVFAPAGIVLGHIAKRQLKTSGESGDGIATAGLIISYVFTGISVLACCGIIGAAIIASQNGSTG